MLKGTRKTKEVKSKNEPEAVEAKEETPEVHLEAYQPVSRPDRCHLDEKARFDSLKMMMQRLPKQYMLTPEQTKENLYNILQFEPTDEQLAKAQEAIDNESKRNS
jgi:hypothetical protein